MPVLHLGETLSLEGHPDIALWPGDPRGRVRVRVDDEWILINTEPKDLMTMCDEWVDITGTGLQKRFILAHGDYPLMLIREKP